MRHLGSSTTKRVAWKAALTGAAVLFIASGVLAADPASAPAGPDKIEAPAPAAPSPAGTPASAPGKDDGETVKIVQSGVFDIHARNTDLRALLTLLSNQGRKNIIATKEVAGNVSADLYGVTFKEALDALLRTTGFRYEEKGNFVYVYTPDQYDKIKKDERKMVTRSFRLVYINANDAKTLLVPALSGDATVAITPAAAIGITPSKVETGGNSNATDDVLVIRDDEEHLNKAAEMLKEIDVKPEQVLIEATILKARLDETNQLGVDLEFLGGIHFNAVDTPGTITAKDLSANHPAADFRTEFTPTVDSGGLSFGLVTNNVSMIVRALESITPTTVLANPKLLVVNKQRGEVLVGNRDGYLTTTVTETVATQTVQFLETGTRLIVRPFIGKNGQIRLELHPEDSIGSVVLKGNNALPSQSTTEMTTNVMVRDGHTIVIGGLFREVTTAARTQTPVLGNLPGVGPLFRASNDTTVREEVIILITPRIIKQQIDEATSEQIKEDVERYRIGARNGLTCWGRERLAQGFMRAARHEINEGDLDKALWDVDFALSMEPQMTEAIVLKEQLTNKAYWSTESRVSDAHWIVQRMMLQELGKPLELLTEPHKPLNVDTLPLDVRQMFDIKARPQLTLPETGMEDELKCWVCPSEVKATPATLPAEAPSAK